jgi:antibiotic biosynthesis monooxygenase (ABM) superfamily enzyme
MQTCVRPESVEDFQRWQRRYSEIVAGFGGYLDGELVAPSPPVQVDWVLIERFTSATTARAWLQSEEQQALADELQPFLARQVDVLLFTGSAARPAAVSAIITTRVEPDRLDAFLRWQRRVAVAQASSEGFRGYKLEPPVAGVQPDWVIALSFDSDDHLDAWLDSPQRHALLEEASAFDTGTRVRKIRNGFESWYASRPDGVSPSPPAWKQNALILLILYPVVVLFGKLIQTPLLVDKGVPFWLALFIANAVSVALLGWVLVPRADAAFRWWLAPEGSGSSRAAWAGLLAIGVGYGLCLALGALLLG